jgi:hypothetical protein
MRSKDRRESNRRSLRGRDKSSKWRSRLKLRLISLRKKKPRWIAMLLSRENNFRERQIGFYRNLRKSSERLEIVFRDCSRSLKNLKRF